MLSAAPGRLCDMTPSCAGAGPLLVTVTVNAIDPPACTEVASA